MSDTLLRVILLGDRKAKSLGLADMAAALGVHFSPALLELLIWFMWVNSEAQVHTAVVFV